jgi:hypothetical protein
MANVRFSLLSTAIALIYPARFAYYVVDDTAAAAPLDQPAGDAAPADPVGDAAAVAESAQSTSDEAPATVSIEVPAQHQSLLERAAALLSRSESWIADNIEAGISHFEAMFKKDDKPNA